jgi:hypothetical protein
METNESGYRYRDLRIRVDVGMKALYRIPQEDSNGSGGGVSVSPLPHSMMFYFTGRVCSGKASLSVKTN